MRRPPIRKTSYVSNPKANLQFGRIIAEAASELEVDAHAVLTGGTHGIPEGESFESKAGAQAKAEAAFNSALQEANDYTDQEVESLKADLRRGGATSERPSNPESFTMYFDTDLGVPVWWTGSDWVDAGGNVV